MCGFLGCFSFSALKKPLINKIKLLSKEIDHRGPDNTGELLIKADSHFCFFVHKRLRILDLTSNSDQPLESKDKRYSLVYNGEIYNYLELKKELISKNIKFNSTSDTEVLLNGLISEGISFLNKCNGMWSFAFWDNSKKEGILCRDRFGVKPLYWRKDHEDCIIFGSEIQSLLLEGDVISEEYKKIAANSAFELENSDFSPIKDINKIKSGHLAIIKKDQIKEYRWYSPEFNDTYKSYKEYISCWRETFLDSVKIRTRSDIPIALTLSGGLDSASICASLNYLIKNQNLVIKDLKAFTFSHGQESSIDESIDAQRIAKNCDVPIETLFIDEYSEEFNIKNTLKYLFEPYITFTSPMFSIYRKIKDAGYSVCLEGHGADELLSGYGHVRKLYPSVNIREWKELTLNLNKIENWYYNKRPNKSFIRKSIFYYLKTIFKHNLSTNFIHRSLNNMNLNENYINRVLNMSPFNRELWVLFNMTTLPTLLRNYDRFSMRSSVESRSPFLDYRLVELTLNAPEKFKYRNGKNKNILREAMKGILNEEDRTKLKKIGFNSDMNKILRGNIGQELLSYLNMKKNLNHRQIIDLKNFLSNKKINDHLKANQIWNSIYLNLWESTIEDYLYE